MARVDHDTEAIVQEERERNKDNNNNEAIDVGKKRTFKIRFIVFLGNICFQFR